MTHCQRKKNVMTPLDTWFVNGYKERDMKTSTIRLQARVSAPCEAESAYLADLATLPESSPELLMRRSGMDEAMRTLAAARKCVEEAEASAREAGKRLRAMVERDWKPSEIPQSVRDGLNVW